MSEGGPFSGEGKESAGRCRVCEAPLDDRASVEGVCPGVC